MARMKQTHRSSVRQHVGKCPRPRISRKKAVPGRGGVKRSRRWRPGTVALREIRKYQLGTDTLIPKRSFQRLIKEITQNLFPTVHYRFQSASLLALQVCAEDFLIERLSDTQIAAIHAGRQTIKVQDMQLVNYYKGIKDHVCSN